MVGYTASTVLISALAMGEEQAQPGAAGKSAAAAAVAMLPSLFILGRSWLYIAGELQNDIPSLIQEQQQPGSSAQEQQQSGSSAQEQQQPVSSEHRKTWSFSLGPVLEWLQAGSTSEQLAAAGYTLQSILQQLGQVVESSEAVFTHTDDRQPDEAAFLAVVRQLRSTGLALCSFAVPCVCNNPGCFNLSGPSALHLVSGRSCLCGGCRTARFCSHTCLRACWKQHKPVCEALAAAAAASGAEA
jgi:hypothetical protein